MLEEKLGFISQCNEKDSSRPMSCHVAFSDTIIVPEYCQMQLSVSVEGCRPDLGQENDLILEPEAKFMERHGLLVAHSLVVIRRRC